MWLPVCSITMAEAAVTPDFFLIQPVFSSILIMTGRGYNAPQLILFI